MSGKYKRRRPPSHGNTEIEDLNYKNVDLLMNYISSQGKILGRKYTGLNAKKQRLLSKAIRRARVMGLVPYSIKKA